MNNLEISEFGLWAIDCHAKTNHFYDDGLPYSYHLKLAFNTYNKFKHLLTEEQRVWFGDAIWGHDLIEDARVTYNEIVANAIMCGHTKENAKKIAECIRAVTNYGRGRNRDERMPDYIYKEILETEGAAFAKLCDRIANVKHGFVSESTMAKKYSKENAHFKKMIYIPDLEPMWFELDNLFNLIK